MAGGLSAFLAQNAVKPENIRFAASRRFVDEDGKPMLWELRPLMSEEEWRLDARCFQISTTKACRTATA